MCIEMKFYRFRTLDNLLGKRKELENQEIYFASPEQQNDPMEGYHDIYFQGDSVIWESFFKNYLFLLDDVFIQIQTQKPRSQFKEPNHIGISYEWNKLPKLRQAHLKNILEDFLSNNEIQDLISDLSMNHRQFSLPEIKLYLPSIHSFAINSLNNIYSKLGLPIFKGKLNISNNLNKDFFLLRDQSENNNDEKLIFPYMLSIIEQQRILYKLTNKKLTAKSKFLIEGFPNFYIKQLMPLLYQKWYSACFMNKESSTSSSVWGSYGSNHTGICLIFNSEMKNESLTLGLYTPKFSNESNTYEQRLTPQKFYCIEYGNEPNSFNLFTSLGRINPLDLDRNWLINFKGETSYLRSSVFQNYNVWHESYHDTFIKNITRKSKDWRYENEYRLILDEFCYDYSNPKDRTLKYEFSSLHGLIFGISTPEKDKIKIIKIIAQKCRENSRTDFNFYQAYFCHKTQSIQHMPLHLIKFKF